MPVDPAAIRRALAEARLAGELEPLVAIVLGEDAPAMWNIEAAPDEAFAPRLVVALDGYLVSAVPLDVARVLFPDLAHVLGLGDPRAYVTVIEVGAEERATVSWEAIGEGGQDRAAV